MSNTNSGNNRNDNRLDNRSVPLDYSNKRAKTEHVYVRYRGPSTRRVFERQFFESYRRFKRDWWFERDWWSERDRWLERCQLAHRALSASRATNTFSRATTAQLPGLHSATRLGNKTHSFRSTDDRNRNEQVQQVWPNARVLAQLEQLASEHVARIERFASGFFGSQHERLTIDRL